MSVNLPTNPMFGINPKVWGKTQSILLNNSVHVAYANISAGGFSSLHYHDKLWNRFFVISGILEIETKVLDSFSTIVLGPGQVADIEPKMIHRMKAITDVDLIELYWADDPNGEPVNPRDIVRENNGGISQNLKED